MIFIYGLRDPHIPCLVKFCNHAFFSTLVMLQKSKKYTNFTTNIPYLPGISLCRAVVEGRRKHKMNSMFHFVTSFWPLDLCGE